MQLVLGVAVHAYYLSTGEAEAGRLPGFQGQPGLHSKFKTGLNYIVRLYPKQTKQKPHLLLTS